MSNAENKVSCGRNKDSNLKLIILRKYYGKYSHNKKSRNDHELICLKNSEGEENREKKNKKRRNNHDEEASKE